MKYAYFTSIIGLKIQKASENDMTLLRIQVEVSLVYTKTSWWKTGVSDKGSMNVIYNLIWVSDCEILCTLEKASVFILDSEKNSVDMINI